MFPTSFRRTHILLICWLVLVAWVFIAKGTDSILFGWCVGFGGIFVGAMYGVILFNRMIMRGWHNDLRANTRTRLEAEAEWRREQERKS